MWSQGEPRRKVGRVMTLVEQIQGVGMFRSPAPRKQVVVRFGRGARIDNPISPRVPPLHSDARRPTCCATRAI
jgi:hypothetical protein